MLWSGRRSRASCWQQMPSRLAAREAQLTTLSIQEEGALPGQRTALVRMLKSPATVAGREGHGNRRKEAAGVGESAKKGNHRTRAPAWVSVLGSWRSSDLLGLCVPDKAQVRILQTPPVIYFMDSSPRERSP